MGDEAKRYSATFLRAIEFVLPHEEEFARGHWGDERFVIAEHVAGDRGGTTKYGIDQASHPGVDIENLTRPQAVDIYWREWEKYHVDCLPEKIAIAQFDVRVNGGYAVAWLQRALNAVCKAGLSVDGGLGAKTMSAAHTCNENAVVKYFLEERDARFDSIAKNNPSQKKFLDGWKERDADLRGFLQIA